MSDAPGSTGSEAEYLIVGTIRKPHGIRGELFVWLETDRPAAVFRPGRVLQVGDSLGRQIGGALTVERVRPFKSEGVLLRVLEHTSRTEATDALRGRSLLIPATEAAPLGEGEVFYHQLPGLRVVVAGETVGTVREVYEESAADLLAVERPGAGELLIPLVREWVRRIDPEERILELDPPAGLLEL